VEATLQSSYVVSNVVPVPAGHVGLDPSEHFDPVRVVPGGQIAGVAQKLPAADSKFVPAGQVAQESKTAS